MSELLYLVSVEFEQPDNSTSDQPHGLWEDRDKAWGSIQHILKVYSKDGYAQFAPRCVHTYIFTLNSSKKNHTFLYWHEAISAALNGTNPLP